MSLLSNGPFSHNRFAHIDELRLKEEMYFMEQKKKLDKVGKEDADIDNDGDVDKSDSYLHNRRKAIGKAMGKDKDKKEMKESCSPTCDCEDCNKKRAKKKEMKEAMTIKEQVMDYLMENGFANNWVSAEVVLNNMSEDWLNHVVNELTE